MNKFQISTWIFVLCACGPAVAEPVDDEAYELCEALYDHARSCGQEIEEDAADDCANQPPWDGACRGLQEEQFECYTALSCADETEMTAAFQNCEAKLHEKSQCYAMQRGH